MPGWPLPPGQRSITIALPGELVAHLDARAVEMCCTRAAYLRQLILSDRKRSRKA